MITYQTTTEYSSDTVSTCQVHDMSRLYTTKGAATEQDHYSGPFVTSVVSILLKSASAGMGSACAIDSAEVRLLLINFDTLDLF
jgi:hypothetical protein